MPRASRADGPSRYLTWAELACHDSARTPYPAEWRTTRAVVLATEFEALRALAGDRPLLVVSGYRTPAWNRQIGGAAQSQHVEGRAIDLLPVPPLTVDALYDLAAARARDPLSALRGLGLYPRWIHLDVRPSPTLVRWSGAGHE